MKTKMPHFKKSSKSTYMEWLIVRNSSHEETGFSFLDRTLDSSVYKKNIVHLYFLFLCFLLFGLSTSFVLYVVHAFHMPISFLNIALCNAFISYGIAFYYNQKKFDGFRKYIVLALLIVYMLFRFIIRHSLQAGEFRFLSYIALTMNQFYRTSFSVSFSGVEFDLLIFLWVVCFWLDFVFGYFIVKKMDILFLSLLIWPLFACFSFLSNGSMSFYLIVFIIFYLILFVCSMNPIKKRLWGLEKSEQYLKNQTSHIHLQMNLAKYTSILCVVLLSFSILLGTIFSTQFSISHAISNQLSSYLIGMVSHILPSISSGEIQLITETIGGGVSDGNLENEDGLSLSDIDDLKITIDHAINESIYLKGYIGSDYVEGTWVSPSKNGFVTAASSWKIEGDPSLYILNLPYLRMATTNKLDPYTLEVEYLDASSQYLYIPYNTFITEEQESMDGDGSVLGGLYSFNYFSYFEPKDVQDALRAWSTNSKNHTVMDDVENSYASYVSLHYTKTINGLNTLEKDVKEQGFKSSTNIENIEEFVIQYMHDHFTYDTSYTLKKGMDPVEDILVNKRGNSAQYVTIATELFRLCKVPCRYVVGYVASPGMFEQDYSGRYTTILKDSDAHIWCEIYEKGIGWHPVEVLPGVEVEQKQSAFSESEDETKIDDTNTEIDINQSNTPFSLYMGILLCLVGLFGSIGYLYAYHHGYLFYHSINQRIIDVFRYFYKKLDVDESISISSNEFVEFVHNKYNNLSKEDISKMVLLSLKAYFSKEELKEEDLIWMRKIVFNHN